MSFLTGMDAAVCGIQRRQGRAADVGDGEHAVVFDRADHQSQRIAVCAQRAGLRMIFAWDRDHQVALGAAYAGKPELFCFFLQKLHGVHRVSAGRIDAQQALRKREQFSSFV